MRSEIYWISSPTSGRLAIMPRPRGGDWLENEVRFWRSEGVEIVVSLLTPGEVAEFGLAQEEALCNAQGIQFLTFPIADRGIPSSKEAARKLVVELAKRLQEGESIAIHCRQGIGRSALIAIGILVLAGVDPLEAKHKVSAARGCPVPETPEQERWISEFVKEPASLVPGAIESANGGS